MISFILTIFKNIILKLATTGAFSFMQPWLLKVDKWAEDKLGIDLIKQDKKFHEKYPLVAKRIKELEKIAHPKCGIESFDGYQAIDSRLKEIERRLKIK